MELAVALAGFSSLLVAGARGTARRSLEAWWYVEITRISAFKNETKNAVRSHLTDWEIQSEP